MATAPPTNPNTSTRPVSQLLRVPPDEGLWTRYSPHGEAPLSFVGSLALHILVLVLLVVIGVVASAYFNPPAKALPIDLVRLPGGGGGIIHGEGDANGIGTGADEDINGPESTEPTDPDLVKRPPLDVKEMNKVKTEFSNDPYVREIAESGSEQLKKLARLNPNFQQSLHDGMNPGKGKGGAGSGGGKGTGQGTGEGSGTGSNKGPKAPMSVRERRTLRWVMMFSQRSGSEYVAQLRDLGAIIGIPTTRDGENYLICDLTKRPYRFVEFDPSTNTRIWWHDDNPESTKRVLHELGYVPKNPRDMPSQFLAFMDEKLEERMYRMELAYHNLSAEEVEKYETKFRCYQNRETGKFDVQIVSQTPLRKEREE